MLWRPQQWQHKEWGNKKEGLVWTIVGWQDKYLYLRL